MNDTADERLLVSRFLATRDEAAFRELYRRHASFLFHLLVRLTGGREPEAEEGVQETWARAAERLGDFQWRSSLKTWLAGIAIRWWREEARRRGREIAEPGDESLEEAAAPLSGEIDRIDLTRALAELPEGYRAALLLHDVEGYTHEEVAEILGVAEGTSKSQLWRARRALRARLRGGRDG